MSLPHTLLSSGSTYASLRKSKTSFSSRNVPSRVLSYAGFPGSRPNPLSFRLSPNFFFAHHRMLRLKYPLPVKYSSANGSSSGRYTLMSIRRCSEGDAGSSDAGSGVSPPPSPASASSAWQ